MPRSIWKGTISFGLVNIPVNLYSAVDRGNELHFRQLDRRSLSPVKEKRVNETTGDEVPWEEITKGYEYEDGRFVVVDPEELRQASPEATQTIDIVQAVRREEIDPAYFDTPYYLAPQKSGRKGYALLRETLRRSGRVAIARVVIRTKQYLAALMPVGDVIMLDVLRYAYEIRDAEELDLPGDDLDAIGVSDKEVQMAEQLVKAIEEPWQPEDHRDTYRDEVLALIARKAERGELEELSTEATAQKPASDVVDIMAMLKRSVEERGAAGKEAGAPVAVAAGPHGKGKKAA
jgi:DNA end-binding protein Ku